MVSQKVTVENQMGLHTRPAKDIVKLAGSFESVITFQKESKTANAASFISVLSLGAPRGTEIVVNADGEDENQALQAIVNLFLNKFGEE
jgi:phosphocarrier protein HPr